MTHLFPLFHDDKTVEAYFKENKKAHYMDCLIWAIQGRNIKMLEYFLSKDCNKYNKNKRNSSGQSALTVCMDISNEDPRKITVFNLLMDSGLDPNVEDEDGNTALAGVIFCDDQHRLHMAQRLLDSGANPNTKDNHEEPILMSAIELMPELVEPLLKKGANANVTDAEGTPAWEQALDYDQGLDHIKLLFQYGLNVHKKLAIYEECNFLEYILHKKPYHGRMIEEIINLLSFDDLKKLIKNSHRNDTKDYLKEKIIYKEHEELKNKVNPELKPYNRPKI